MDFKGLALHPDVNEVLITTVTAGEVDGRTENAAPALLPRALAMGIRLMVEDHRVRALARQDLEVL